MNERICELVEQARVQDRGYFIYQYGGPTGHQSVEKAIDLEKFAQLIVEECIVIMYREIDEEESKEKNRTISDMMDLLEKHFGVEE